MEKANYLLKEIPKTNCCVFKFQVFQAHVEALLSQFIWIFWVLVTHIHFWQADKNEIANYVWVEDNNATLTTPINTSLLGILRKKHFTKGWSCSFRLNWVHIVCAALNFIQKLLLFPQDSLIRTLLIQTSFICCTAVALHNFEISTVKLFLEDSLCILYWRKIHLFAVQQ